MSYKKLSKINMRSIQTSNVRKFYESAMLQVKLEVHNYELIFVDEFSVSYKLTQDYGWTKKGTSRPLLVSSDSFSYSFIWAFFY